MASVEAHRVATLCRSLVASVVIAALLTSTTACFRRVATLAEKSAGALRGSEASVCQRQTGANLRTERDPLGQDRSRRRHTFWSGALGAGLAI